MQCDSAVLAPIEAQCYVFTKREIMIKFAIDTLNQSILVILIGICSISSNLPIFEKCFNNDLNGLLNALDQDGLSLGQAAT